MGKAKDLGNSVIGNIPKAVIIFYDKVGTGTTATYVGRKIQVQYNPSSISFSTSTDDAELKSIQGSSNSQEIVLQNSSPAGTTMSIDLLFDDVNNMDAFMNEKFTASSGMVASAVAKGVYNKHSVTRQVNVFMGMITSSATRCVTFLWSEFCFQGELTSVGSEFTMFNVSGNPIKGKVSLSIQKKEGCDPVSQNENNKAFDRLFGGDAFASAVTDSKSLGDKLGNLLNLNVL